MQSYSYLILPIHVLSCFFMTGAIWVIQIVHYPTFNYVAENQFKLFHHFHSNQITWIVAPMMGLELVTGLLLCNLLGGIWNIQLILVLSIWAVTFFSSVPMHKKLSQSRDNKLINKLVVTNWLRTLLWTLRSVLILLSVSIQSY